MSNPPNAPQPRCAVCREPIQDGARKCIHCDSYLDWRRYLGFGHTTLALLVALVSVVSSTIPGFVDWLSPDFSEIHAEVRQTYLDHLELFVSNAGNKPGRLVAVDITAVTSDGRRFGPHPLQIAHDEIVGGDQAILAHLSIHPESYAGFLGWPHREISSCILEVLVANYRSKPEKLQVDCSKNLRTFCLGTEGAAIDYGRVPTPAPRGQGRPTSRCS